MRFPSRAALAVLAVWTFHAASAAAQPAGPPLDKSPTEIEAPMKVGEYLRGEWHDFKDPRYGVSYQYAPAQKSDSSYATVYIYQPAPADSAWDAASWIAEQVQGFRQTLEYQVARGVRTTGSRSRKPTRCARALTCSPAIASPTRSGRRDGSRCRSTTCTPPAARW